MGKAKATTKDIKFDSNDKIEISLNAKYINEIVKVLDSENIIIRIENGSTPIWINGEKDIDQKHLLLPMRIA